MKDVLALTKVISDPEYYSGMFDDDDNYGEDANILFVSPQLSGKYFYKSLLPFFCMDDRNEDGRKNTGIAITSLKKYDYEKQLLDYQIVLNDEHVEWADVIVFPFTTQPLAEEIYSRIRELKPEAKIIYNIDFNFYELSVNHPLKEIFSEESVINDVEDNMFYADRVFTTNYFLQKYIIKKFEALSEKKFKGVDVRTGICALPTMINSDIILKNVDWNPEIPSLVDSSNKSKESIAPVNTPDINDKLEKINQVFEKVVDENKKEKESIDIQKKENWELKIEKKLQLTEEKNEPNSRGKTTATRKSKPSKKSSNTKPSFKRKRKSKPKPKSKRKK